MKKILKKSIVLILALVLVCGNFSVMALDGEKQYCDYGSYVLLGDSIASGWSDVVHKDTCFKRVEGSYGAFIADDLGVTYHPMAAIAFRTVEMRYMFEDDYEGDEFLFYSVEKDFVDSKIPEVRKAVSEAGLITLNVGGNDWGSYVGWHIQRAMEEISGTENFVEKALPYLEGTVNFGVETIEALIDMADLAGCLPDLITVLPKALDEGFRNYMANWNIMIEDIYALNPDVTLVVIGMFDTALQDESMSEVENEGFDIQNAATKIEVGQTIVDFANIVMRQGAEKYGYIFVDPVGTLCEKQHPSTAGHRFIADKVLEALPDARFPYTDLTAGTKEFTYVQKLFTKGYMFGVSETEFAPSQALTKGQLADVLYNIAGAPEVEGTLNDTTSASAAWAVENGILTADENGNFSPEKEITRLNFAQYMFKNATATNGGFVGLIKGVRMLFKVITDNILSSGKAIERIDAAKYFVIYCGI